MSKPKVFITRCLIAQSLSEKIATQCEVDVWEEELPPTPEALRARVRGVHGILAMLTDRIDGTVMDAAGTQLKVISNHAVGYDNIEVSAATQRKIPVGNTPGILTNATADFTWALLLAAARRVVEAEAYVRAGKWKTWHPSMLLGADLAGATLGIIGYGRIGRAVAKRAHGFEMRVIYFNRADSPDVSDAYAQRAESLEALLGQADFVSLHLPLNAHTKHFINAHTLSLMKPSAILINTTRGGTVDQAALYEALKTKRIAGAAIDVTDPEPLPMDSPLLQLDNLVIAPHIASASAQTRYNMAAMAAENLIAGVKGERLPNCVNPEVMSEK